MPSLRPSLWILRCRHQKKDVKLQHNTDEVDVLFGADLQRIKKADTATSELFNTKSVEGIWEVFTELKSDSILEP